MSDHLEGQRQEHAIHLYHHQADELERWLIRMRNAVICSLELRSQEKADMEDQLDECQVSTPPTVHSKNSKQIRYLEIFRKVIILEILCPQNGIENCLKIQDYVLQLFFIFQYFIQFDSGSCKSTLYFQCFVSLLPRESPQGDGTFHLINKSISGVRGAFRRLGVYPTVALALSRLCR